MAPQAEGYVGGPNKPAFEKGKNQIFKYIKAYLKLHWRFQECMTTLWVIILLLAIGQLSDSKEVLSGNMLVVGQSGLLTIPHKLLSHMAPIAIF